MPIVGAPVGHLIPIARQSILTLLIECIRRIYRTLYYERAVVDALLVMVPNMNFQGALAQKMPS